MITLMLAMRAGIAKTKILPCMPGPACGAFYLHNSMGISLLTQPATGGRLSLYLYVSAKGYPRKKEFLGIYVQAKPRTAAQRDENARLYAAAELKLSERKVDLAKYGGGIRLEKSVLTISEYCRSIGITKRAKKTQAAWSELSIHLDKSSIGKTLLTSLSVQDCITFRNYLTNSKLAQSTQSKHYGAFKNALKQAHLSYFLSANLHDRLSSVSRGHATKEFLRQAELDLLFSTPVRSQLTRSAFLFSCLTGMRHSDIKALKWSNVYDMPDGGTELRYKMQKTGKAHILPIGTQAREVMGNRGRGIDSVMPGTPSIQSVNYTLHLWCKRAGIAKSISFHCARHTFATLCLSAGTPLKVVSDYLGHSSITQTEVYARLLEDERDRYVGRVGLTVAEPKPEPALRLVK